MYHGGYIKGIGWVDMFFFFLCFWGGVMGKHEIRYLSPSRIWVPMGINVGIRF